MNGLLAATDRAIARLVAEGDTFASRELLADLKALREKLFKERDA